jgi:hypothetical protein
LLPMPPLIMLRSRPDALSTTPMKATAIKTVKRALALLVALLVLILAWRVYDSLRAPHLERWHTFVPDEASASQIAQLDWAG